VVDRTTTVFVESDKDISCNSMFEKNVFFCLFIKKKRITITIKRINLG